MRAIDLEAASPILPFAIIPRTKRNKKSRVLNNKKTGYREGLYLAVTKARVYLITELS